MPVQEFKGRRLQVRGFVRFLQYFRNNYLMFGTFAGSNSDAEAAPAFVIVHDVQTGRFKALLSLSAWIAGRRRKIRFQNVSSIFKVQSDRTRLVKLPASLLHQSELWFQFQTRNFGQAQA